MDIRGFSVRLITEVAIGILSLIVLLFVGLVLDIILVVSSVMSVIKRVLFRPEPWKDFTDAVELTSDNDLHGWVIRGSMLVWFVLLMGLIQLLKRVSSHREPS